jgi:hypothetical protein
MKLEEVGSITNVEPAKFCYIKAKEVLLEYWRKPERKETGLGDSEAQHPIAQNTSEVGNPNVLWEEKEKQIECLEQCLRKLERGDHDLILLYYYGEKRVKIDNHRKDEMAAINSQAGKIAGFINGSGGALYVMGESNSGIRTGAWGWLQAMHSASLSISIRRSSATRGRRSAAIRLVRSSM